MFIQTEYTAGNDIVAKVVAEHNQCEENIAGELVATLWWYDQTLPVQRIAKILEVKLYSKSMT
jgi:hypothetical protein